MVWKFMLPSTQCTVAWLPFMDRSDPKQVFLREGQSLRPIALQAPGPEVWLRHIVVFHRGPHQAAVHGRIWKEDNLMLTQYKWKGGPQLTSYSTGTSRHLQNQTQVWNHPAIQKWETQLGVRLPEHIWHNTWLPFRSAKVNTFLWLVVFRAIATLSWVFPNRPHTDPTTWCPRCTLGIREDILHCLWQCLTSQLCWLWSGWVLSRAVRYSLHAPIGAAHILMAVPLPDSFDAPFRLWQLLRAATCWQIWKARNDRVFSNLPFNPDAVIRKI